MPFFLLLLVVEALLLRVSEIPSIAGHHRFADTWSSLASGSAQRMYILMVFKIGLKTFSVTAAYRHIHQHYAIYHVPLTTHLSWVLTLLFIDFSYYWSHRMGHQLAFLWAGHSVHHSSEHYNLSTALRQSIWQHLYETLSFIPAALFFPPSLYITCVAWNTIYQFWVHTCCIRRLGLLELILMTPSHHRIHHDRRVHKNYGGVLIIWDRMFGTFLDEEKQIQALEKGKEIKMKMDVPGHFGSDGNDSIGKCGKILLDRREGKRERAYKYIYIYIYIHAYIRVCV